MNIIPLVEVQLSVPLASTPCNNKHNMDITGPRYEWSPLQQDMLQNDR